MAEKSDLAKALTQPSLQPFEGRQVIGAAIEIPNAAGGLRDAMAIDPVELHHGEEGFLLFHYRTKKVRFDPIPKTDALTRVMVLDVDEGVFVDAEFAADHLAEQRQKITAAKEAAEAEARRQKGEYTIEEEALEAEHIDGQHAGELRDGCPECDKERAAEAAEAGGGFGPEDE